MSCDFNVGKESLQGLGTNLTSKSKCANLALVKCQPRQWKLIDLEKETCDPTAIAIQGKELVSLMKAVANNIKNLPASIKTINEKEFHELAGNSKFRNLCRLIPGIETPEHSATRTKAAEAFKRTAGAAKIIGKGLVSIEKQGLEGRYVGQDQKEHPYWIRELFYRDTTRTLNEVDTLIEGWKQDKSSNLSLKEWEESKRKEWEHEKPGVDFLPWVAKNAWHAQAKRAFEKENPGIPFDEAKLSKWQAAQADPELFLPTWLLKEISEKQTDPEFQTWRTEVLKDRKEVWEKFKKETGASSLSFNDHEQLEFEHGISGSSETGNRWMLQRLYERAKVASSTQDDFPTFVRRLKFTYDFPSLTTEADFRKWNAAEEQALHKRHEGSHLPLPFEKWKAQQDSGIMIEPAPFVRLNEEERRVYRTTCQAGILTRNGFPLDTAFDKTLHSGSGYAIFVIGPDKDLYCGSHIGGVFHHSSFLGDSATVAAGEIKTNPDGSIAELSSKSGHYRPTDAQNLYTLRYFRDRGLDLSKIDFTFYDPTGKTERHNALAYLTELEKTPRKYTSTI